MHSHITQQVLLLDLEHWFSVDVNFPNKLTNIFIYYFFKGQTRRSRGLTTSVRDAIPKGNTSTPTQSRKRSAPS